MATENQTIENVTTENVTNVQTITCGVRSVQVYSNGDNGVRYRLTIDTAIDAIKKNDNGDYVLAQVDYVDFVPAVIIAQLINLVQGVDIMYTKKKEQGIRNDNGNGFGAAELQAILRDAKLEIKRTKFEAGHEYTDKAGEVHVHENTGYNTDIIGVKVSKRIELLLDKVIDSMFDI